MDFYYRPTPELIGSAITFGIYERPTPIYKANQIAALIAYVASSKSSDTQKFVVAETPTSLTVSLTRFLDDLSPREMRALINITDSWGWDKPIFHLKGGEFQLELSMEGKIRTDRPNLIRHILIPLPLTVLGARLTPWSDTPEGIATIMNTFLAYNLIAGRFLDQISPAGKAQRFTTTINLVHPERDPWCTILQNKSPTVMRKSEALITKFFQELGWTKVEIELPTVTIECDNLQI